MKLAWLVGSESFSLHKPYTWFCLGVRGAGKSSFLEHLAELHLAEGNTVLDLFAARSGENLAWLRSKWAETKKILLLCDGAAIVEAPPKVSVKPYTNLSLNDFEEYDIIINCSLLYPNLDSEFNSVNYIIEKLWKRLKWYRLVFVVCREAANLLYSRLKIVENQTAAKAFLSYWLRESRHVGCSLGLDSQRLMAVDVEIRSVIDFLVLKQLGASGLPHDLWFIYRHLQPSWLQNMRPNQFAVLSRKGSIGAGVFPYPSWHKIEGEDILHEVKLKVQFEEKPEEAKYRGSFNTIGDMEHVEIVRLYVEEQLSMEKIGKQLKRSNKSIHDHLTKHDAQIESLGYCPQCRRSKGKYETVKAKRV